MTWTGPAIAVAPTAMTDAELVADVRAGADGAFEELYRRHQRGVAALVHRLVRDRGRAEDVTQEAFVAALRGIRVSERPIVFKPWMYEIARNAAIDNHRRAARSQEVSIDAAAQRPLDRGRLVGLRAPESEVIERERMSQLYGALGELSDSQERIILLRELEGLSYRQIARRLGLSQSAVEASLFRARRRLQTAYVELDTGRRCAQMRAVAAHLAEGVGSTRDRQRLHRHARRCAPCRRHAHSLGVAVNGQVGRRAGALVPLAGLLRRRGSAPAGGSDSHGSYLGTLLSGADPAVSLPAKAIGLIAAAALAAGGGAATLAGIGPLARDHAAAPAAHARPVPPPAGGPARAGRDAPQRPIATPERGGLGGASMPESRAVPNGAQEAVPPLGAAGAPRVPPGLKPLGLPHAPALPRLPSVDDTIRLLPPPGALELKIPPAAQKVASDPVGAASGGAGSALGAASGTLQRVVPGALP